MLRRNKREKKRWPEGISRSNRTPTNYSLKIAKVKTALRRKLQSTMFLKSGSMENLFLRIGVPRIQSAQWPRHLIPIAKGEECQAAALAWHHSGSAGFRCMQNLRIMEV